MDGVDCYGEPRFAELREQKFQEEDQPLMHDIKDSEEIYENACIPILGKCKTKILLKKKQRSDKNQYKEFIYVWRKK